MKFRSKKTHAIPIGTNQSSFVLDHPVSVRHQPPPQHVPSSEAGQERSKIEIAVGFLRTTLATHHSLLLERKIDSPATTCPRKQRSDQINSMREPSLFYYYYQQHRNGRLCESNGLTPATSFLFLFCEKLKKNPIVCWHRATDGFSSPANR